ncbi:MAG: hypothetical protein Q9208_005291 [Pyrenodesmia sp. 3 TL-2023]
MIRDVEIILKGDGSATVTYRTKRLSWTYHYRRLRREPFALQVDANAEFELQKSRVRGLKELLLARRELFVAAAGVVEEETWRANVASVGDQVGVLLTALEEV